MTNTFKTIFVIGLVCMLSACVSIQPKVMNWRLKYVCDSERFVARVTSRQYGEGKSGVYMGISRSEGVKQIFPDAFKLVNFDPVSNGMYPIATINVPHDLKEIHDGLTRIMLLARAPINEQRLSGDVYVIYDSSYFASHQKILDEGRQCGQFSLNRVVIKQKNKKGLLDE